MSGIRSLKDTNLNTHLVYTKSSLAEMYVYDTLKDKCGASRDSIYEVNSKKTFDMMVELVNTQPFLAEKWLFIIDYTKIKKTVSSKISIFSVDTSEFIVKVKNYGEFKELKDLLSPVKNVVNELYLAFLRFDDIQYLINGYQISDKLSSFIYKSYSSDPEQIFILLKELKNGREITSRKQITEICGISTGSLNSFAISLLGDKPKEGRGQRTVIKNRIRVANELIEVYGYSKMRNFLMASVKDILDIKTLFLTGVIYDRISDIPEVWVTDNKGDKVLVYDEKRLSRYKSYLETIKQIPYTRIMNLYLLLKNSGKWYKDRDMVNFIYMYYKKGD